MDTTPVLIVADDPPCVDRVAERSERSPRCGPPLVRLLEWSDRRGAQWVFPSVGGTLLTCGRGLFLSAQ
jgi:hypothetical protein